MRLIKIGRGSSNTIVYNDSGVSELHAELIMLNNGDILLEDKGSTNGTFVNGQRITPGKQVNVKRGDLIKFGKQELSWSDVPTIQAGDYTAMYGIGTAYQNDIRLTGDKVSRYHATLKKGKDNKWYIEDHSKNGTMINGQLISSGQDVRIKSGDTISCGGQVVDLSSYIKGKSSFGPALKAVAAVAVVAVIGWVVYMVVPKGNQDKDYSKSTACVFHNYHFEVTLDDDPLLQVFKDHGVEGWPEKYEFGVAYDSESGSYEVGPIGATAAIFNAKDKEFGSASVTGTAFFVSDDGRLLTNRHVAMPWLYDEELLKKVRAEMGAIQQSIFKGSSIADYFEDSYSNQQISELLDRIYAMDKKLTLNDRKNWEAKYTTSSMKIDGVTDFLGIGEAYTMLDDYSDLQKATVLHDSGTDDIDVAVMQLNNKQTPLSVKDHLVNLGKNITDTKDLKPGRDKFIFYGYPAGVALNLDNKNNFGLTPQVYEIGLSRVPGRYEMELQGQVLGGASGSPIIDKDGNFVGIINKAIDGTTISRGVLGRHAIDVYNESLKKEGRVIPN